MGEPSKKVQLATTTVEGLEDLLVSSVDPGRMETDSTLDQGWTLNDAAEAFEVTERTVRRWIKEKRIRAWKVDGPRGPEWRINPGSTPDGEAIHAGSMVYTESHTVLFLSELVREQAFKLEIAQKELIGASYRNGYLESQLSTITEQVKLLPDLEAQAAMAARNEARAKKLEDDLLQLRGHWWNRFWSWFTGTKVL